MKNTITTINRGKSLIVHEGYEYNGKVKNTNVIRLCWICVNRDTCKWWIITNKKSEQYGNSYMHWKHAHTWLHSCQDLKNNKNDGLACFIN